MVRVIWRNLVARKLRLLLSAFAIVLGVSFVVGSMVFTHAIGAVFDGIIEHVYTFEDGLVRHMEIREP